jgi:hypothetical protein
MLRGDYKRAREKLAMAQRQEPGNRYVLNNIQLLEDSYRTGKAIRWRQAPQDRRCGTISPTRRFLIAGRLVRIPPWGRSARLSSRLACRGQIRPVDLNRLVRRGKPQWQVQ